jgi:hypothetical protein
MAGAMYLETNALERKSMSLASAVHHWITPMARDYKGHTNNPETRGYGGTLPDQVLERSGGGQLNPTWVELLMGWPEGWTCLCPISGVKYLQWLMETADDQTQNRTSQILRVLRNTHAQEEISKQTGRLFSVHETAILLSDMCEYAGRANGARVFLACAEALEVDMRGLRDGHSTASASYRPANSEQRSIEHSNAVQALSRLLAHYGQEAWVGGGWENAVPRVAHGVAARVDRLRCVGNGQVPAVAALAWRILRR